MFLKLSQRSQDSNPGSLTAEPGHFTTTPGPVVTGSWGTVMCVSPYTGVSALMAVAVNESRWERDY